MTMPVSAQRSRDFCSVLQAHKCSHEIPESEDVYGWLVGSWEFDVFDHLGDGTVRPSNGEVHFGWVLEGRAIQDVWIIPRIFDRKPDLSKAGNRYGMTLRVWDANIKGWRITWINPVTGARDELVGRKISSEIVQIGTHSDGTPIRWNFTNITPDSFRWLGESLQPDGKTWKTETEFHVRRISR